MRLTDHRSPFLAGALLFLITFIVYIPAMRAGFVWDDDVFLWDNPLIKAPNGLRLFWFTTLAPDYFPLTSSMLWVEWRIFGAEHPSGYHAINVLLHALSSLLLWRLLVRLEIPGAWLAAAVFAVHPVNVESVAWITQRKNTLSMALAMLSVLLFFDSRETGKQMSDAIAPFRAPRYWLSLLCFLLALLAKTSVVPLPAVLLLLTWWRSGSVTRRALVRILPFFALAGGLAVVTLYFQNLDTAEVSIRDDGFLSRIAVSGRAIWFYFSKALLPLNLSFVYPLWEVPVTNPAAFIPAVLAGALLAGLWAYRADPRASAAFTAFACYVILLFPALGFFNIFFMQYSLVSDHWQYFAMPALIAPAAALLARAGERRGKPVVARAIASVVLVSLAILSWRQAGDYRDAETLWLATIERNPNAWVAHYNRSLALLEEGRREEALASYRKAEKLRPDYPGAPNNFGNALLHRGDLDGAIALFRKALEADPDYAKAHNNLGYALSQKENLGEAIGHYRKALEIKGDYDTARVNLGRILTRIGQFDEARFQFEEALKANAANVAALNQLAWLLATSPGSSPDDGLRAVELAQRAQRLLGPGDPALLRTFAAAFARAERFEEAVNTARQAIDVAVSQGDPRLADVVRNELTLYSSGAPNDASRREIDGGASQRRPPP